MKKIILSQLILSFMLINCQEKTTEKLPLKTNVSPTVSNKHVIKINNGKLDFKELQFGADVEEILKATGLTLSDNASPDEYYNMAGDFEEFQFPKNKKSNLLIAGNNLLSSDHISLFYFTKNKQLWCYEMELMNHKNASEIINAITKTIGSKPAFFEKLINTKARPVFLDENGELETKHIEETREVWEDVKNKTTYFFINTINYTKNESVLKIFALDKSSPKYKEWVSYRSLTMLYDK